MGNLLGCRLSADDLDQDLVVQIKPSDYEPGAIWKHQISMDEAKTKYSNKVNFTADAIVEFRTLLDDSVATRYFFDFVKRKGDYGLVKCWKDIQAVKCMVSLDPNLNAQTYTKVPPSIYEDLSICIGNEVDKSLSLGKLEEICSDALYNDKYKLFLYTPEFKLMCNELRKSYNYVDVDDFEYFDKLSEGAYGLIVHVRKKSTYQHYAMKIQHKALLIRHYKEETHRVVQEMQTMACCKHPYIINIAYAFQTHSLAIFAMPLCIYGDLGTLILNSPNMRIPLDHVIFYSAEIVSAITYLHSCGLIYRDLKPANVLLHGNGHIQLADFGAIADVDGIISECILHSRGKKAVTKQQKNKEMEELSPMDDVLPLFRAYSSIATNNDSNNISRISTGVVAKTGEINADGILEIPMLEEVVGEGAPNAYEETIESQDMDFKSRDRAKSIVGTVAYMAPEILVKFGMKERLDITYSKAVDYWSLGVTVYAMLYGKLPYKRLQVEVIQQQLQDHPVDGDEYYNVFRQMFGSIQYFALEEFASSGEFVLNLNESKCDHSLDDSDMFRIDEITKTIESFINSLLQFDPRVRMGEKSIKHGEPFNIKSHAFFDKIDWDLVEGQLIQPPKIPAELIELADKNYGTGLVGSTSLEALLIQQGKHNWVCDDNQPTVIQTVVEDGVNKQNSYKNKFYISEAHQKLFADWYYTSPAVIDLEQTEQLKKGNHHLEVSM